MATIRAVGFDLDGTLFDHVGAASDGLGAFLAQLGVVPSPDVRALWFQAEDEFHELWKTGAIMFQEQRRRRLQAFLPGVGVDVPPTPEALDELFDSYLREYTAAWRAFPDAADVLMTLRQNGILLGVLTNGSDKQQLAKLRAIGLLDLVDVVCTAEALGVWKPDHRAFAALTSRLGVAPGDCLFVGDHPDQDIAGALAAGMPALIVDHYAHGAAGLSAVVGRALPQ